MKSTLGKTFKFDLRREMSVFELPIFEALTFELERILGQDDFVLEALRRERTGTYFVHVKDNAQEPSGALNFIRKERFTDLVRNISVPLQPFKQKKDGTLVTIIRS